MEKLLDPRPVYYKLSQVSVKSGPWLLLIWTLIHTSGWLSKYVSQCVQCFIMLIVFAGEDHSTTLPVGDEMWHIVSYISVPKARRTLPLLPPEVNTTLILLVYQNIKTVEQYRNDFVTMAFDILYFQELYMIFREGKENQWQVSRQSLPLVLCVYQCSQLYQYHFISMLPSKCTGKDPEDNKMVTSWYRLEFLRVLDLEIFS